MFYFFQAAISFKSLFHEATTISSPVKTSLLLQTSWYAFYSAAAFLTLVVRVLCRTKGFLAVLR